jgi:endonuclease/exonuclease/phosphatase family metal-dependent hydrolase
VHYIWLNRETGPWSVGDWNARKESLDQAFKALDADVIGFQEMESFARGSVQPVNLTLDWLTMRNPGYGVAAAGNPAVFPSTQPILYRDTRLRTVDEGWFFFSETPDALYARTYDGGFPAFASWARFEDRATDRAFRVVNVHFDYASGSNRRRSADLVAERIAPWIAAGETVFVIGDINASAASRPARTLKDAGLTFARVPGSTYHWNRGLNLTPAIDHLASTPDARPTGSAVILRRRFAGNWPSDHYPVLADFEW